MSYDGIMMHQVIGALNNTITGGRINKIYQISKYELLINVRSNRTNYKLLLSCHPMYARIQLTNLNYPTPDSPNPLTMLFRKHLDGGYIKAVKQIELDRICHIIFGSYNEFGDYVEYNCYIEIMGKHSNAILTYDNNKIIDCGKTSKKLNERMMYFVHEVQKARVNLFKTMLESHIIEYSNLNQDQKKEFNNFNHTTQYEFSFVTFFQSCALAI